MFRTIGTAISLRSGCNRSFLRIMLSSQDPPNGKAGSSPTGLSYGGLCRSERSYSSYSPPAHVPPHLAHFQVSPGQDGSVRSPLPDLVIPETSLHEHVVMNAKSFGDGTALIDGVTERKVSYDELHDSVIKVASALCRMGLSKGDVITIIAPNSIEWCIMYLATISTGAIVSSVNPLYTTGELTHAVKHSESKYIVTISALANVAIETKKNCPLVKEIIVFDQHADCRPFSSLLADDGQAFPETVSFSPKEDTVALPYSSGTTGLPKGVMLTHHNIVSNIEQIGCDLMLRYTEKDRLLGVLPFFHIYGQVVVLLTALRNGATTIVLPKFDPELYLNACARFQPTYLHIVPPIALFLAKHPLVAKYNLESVHTLFVGAAPCGAETISESLERVNKNAYFRQGYGLTEASPVTNVNLAVPELIRFHTVGPAVPNCDFKILDVESGAVLKQGEEGELCVRGPNVMKGYFKNEEATAKTIIDGYLHTGDVGYYDESGNVIVTDRLKELIKVKGFQVAPAELEALLVSHPSIQDAAVIGKPDAKAGELPRAYVVLKGGESLSELQVQDYVKEHVASFKQLAGGVEFISEIPKSLSGKILRRVLKDELKAAMK